MAMEDASAVFKVVFHDQRIRKEGQQGQRFILCTTFNSFLFGRQAKNFFARTTTSKSYTVS